MKKFFNGINNILYKLFDTNVYGVFSMCSIFLSVVLLVVGQVIPGIGLLFFGGMCLSASISKNIKDAKIMKRIKKQRMTEEIEYEEYSASKSTQKNFTQVQVQEQENQTNKNMTDERTV